MSSLQSVMRCASAVRRKRQRSSRLRPIFPGRVGVSIGRDAEPSDQRRANGSHLEPPGVGKFRVGELLLLSYALTLLRGYRSAKESNASA